MARSRERVPLEDGVKLDLNLLIRQQRRLNEPVVIGTLTCGSHRAGEAAHEGFLVLILSTKKHGALWLTLGAEGADAEACDCVVPQEVAVFAR
jgi:hypothetical protein